MWCPSEDDVIRRLKKGTPGYAAANSLSVGCTTRKRSTRQYSCGPSVTIAMPKQLQTVISEIVAWLTQRIYRHGCRYDPDELLTMCLGEPFDPTYFTDYLEDKYNNIMAECRK